MFTKGFKPTPEMIKKSNETKLKNGVFDRLIIRNKSDKQRQAVGAALKGRKRNDKPWNTGMKGLQQWMNTFIKRRMPFLKSCPFPRNNRKSRDKHPSEETKRKISEANKGKVVPIERIKRCLRRREMSSLEIRVNNVIQKHNLPYRFVGSGDFFIERKNPDFININGHKIAIEVYAVRHKNKFKGGVEEWKKERQEIFSKYGWGIIFIEDWQTNSEESILKILK